MRGISRTVIEFFVSSNGEFSIMAMRCEICGKGPVVGRRVSHAHNVRPRRFEPNLQTVRAVVDGASKRVKVCTRCIRSNKVTKAA
jgi:large subunit ribosomal protein L28